MCCSCIFIYSTILFIIIITVYIKVFTKCLCVFIISRHVLDFFFPNQFWQCHFYDFIFPFVFCPLTCCFQDILRQRTTNLEVKKYCVEYLEKIGSFKYTESVLVELEEKWVGYLGICVCACICVCVCVCMCVRWKDKAVGIVDSVVKCPLLSQQTQDADRRTWWQSLLDQSHRRITQNLHPFLTELNFQLVAFIVMWPNQIYTF